MAAAAAIGIVAGTTATVTAAALGSTVYTLPSNCSPLIVGDLTYMECGTVWYQPHYLGSGVTYVVVNAPR